MKKVRPASNGDRLFILIGMVLIGIGIFNIINTGYTKGTGTLIFFGVVAVLGGLLDPYLALTKK